MKAVYKKCLLLLAVFLEYGILEFMQRYLNILVILLLAFYLFIGSTCSFWNTPLCNYLCRKMFVEDVRKDLFALADFSSYNDHWKKETANGKQLFQCSSMLILK